MLTRRLIGACALGSMALSLSSASAATLEIGAGWSPFVFSQSGDQITDYYTGDTFYTFTLVAPAILKITDAFGPGSVFEFTLNGVSLGDTSMPQGMPFITDDPDFAFNQEGYSHGAYGLNPGTYNLTGRVTYTPPDFGRGFVIIVPGQLSTPEPATWALMIAGFGMVGASMRRRKFALT